MRKGEIMFLGVLLIVIGCTNTPQKKIESDQVVEISFENTNETYTDQTKDIDRPAVVEIFANDLDYNKYEQENAKQEYYNLSDFQGYYAAIITPIIDSLKIERRRLDGRDTRMNFKTKNRDIYIVDSRKIQSKQGLILFNGKSEPIFWKGDKNGELDAFVKEYFE